MKERDGERENVTVMRSGVSSDPSPTDEGGRRECLVCKHPGSSQTTEGRPSPVILFTSLKHLIVRKTLQENIF